jgi:hypothetical protein
MPDRVDDVLVLCAGRTGRPIPAGSILRKHGAVHVGAFAAGRHPEGVENPSAPEVRAGEGTTPPTGKAA